MFKKMMILKILVILFVGIASQAVASEKLVYYQSGALNSKDAEFRHDFVYRGNSIYKIELSFVNYSTSPVSISYQDRNGKIQKIFLNGQEAKKEVLEFTTLKDGKFLVQFKAEANGSKFKFVSYDVVILEN